jgi:hypothetical protein
LFTILAISGLIFTLILGSLVLLLRPKLEKKIQNLKITKTQGRLKRITNFEKLSENILHDILDALKDFNCANEQVHALLPLLADIRKHGQRLVKQRKFYHSYLFAGTEQRLTDKIIRLHDVEIFIKSLSKEPGTLPDLQMTYPMRKDLLK